MKTFYLALSFFLLSVGLSAQSKQAVLSYLKDNGYSVIEDHNFKLKQNQSAEIKILYDQSNRGIDYICAGYSLDKDVNALMLLLMDGRTGEEITGVGFWESTPNPLIPCRFDLGKSGGTYPLIYKLLNKDSKKKNKKYGCGFLIAVKTHEVKKLSTQGEWIVALTAVVAGAVVVNKVYSHLKNLPPATTPYIDPDKVAIPQISKEYRWVGHLSGNPDYHKMIEWADGTTGRVCIYNDYYCTDGYRAYKTLQDAKDAEYVYKKYRLKRTIGRGAGARKATPD